MITFNALNTRMRCLVVTILVVMSGPASASDNPHLSSAPAEIVRLKLIWKDWHKNASKLEVSGFAFRGVFGAEGKHATRDDLIRLIDGPLRVLSLQEHGPVTLQALRDITSPLFGDSSNAPTAAQYTFDPVSQRPLAPVSTRGSWKEFSLLRDSSNARLDFAEGDRKQTVLRTGSSEQHYSPSSRQVSRYTSNSSIVIPGAEMFLYNPDLPQTWGPWETAVPDSTTAKLTCNASEGRSITISYDSITGFVTYHGVKLNADRFQMERFQSGMALLPSGVPVPRLIAEIKYKKGGDPRRVAPDGLVVHLLTHIDTPHDIDNKGFSLAVPEATKIVQFDAFGSHVPPSQGGERPPIVRTGDSVDDVEEFVKSDEYLRAVKSQLPGQPEEMPPKSLSPTLLWIVVINLGLVFIAWICFRRQRSR